jgi:hypothetical protein
MKEESDTNEGGEGPVQLKEQSQTEQASRGPHLRRNDVCLKAKSLKLLDEHVKRVAPVARSLKEVRPRRFRAEALP